MGQFTSVQWSFPNDGRPAIPGSAAQPRCQHLAAESNLLRDFGIACRRQLNLNCGYVRRGEARIYRPQPREAFDQQSRAGQQHQCQSHLCHHQGPAQTSARSAGRRSSALLFPAQVSATSVREAPCG